MRHTLPTLALAAFGLALIGCTVTSPDLDADPTSKNLPQITTKIDATGLIDGQTNKVDWKTMVAPVTGKARLLVEFDDGHDVTGEVGVFEVGGKKSIVTKSVTPDDSVYNLSWEAEEGRTYLFKIAATKGKGDYTISPLDITEPPPPDPCADVECADNEECQEGECVEVEPVECSPPCRGRNVCVDGKCEAPCGGGCPRGEYCHRTRNECLKDPCFGKTCPSGERCVGGNCRPIPKPCGGRCGADEKCVNNRCIKDEAPKEEPKAAAAIRGHIVQVLPDGGRSTLLINRGTQNGVKVGQTGSITGVSGTFKVVEVFQFRAKAVIDVDEKAIGGNKAVTIRP